LKELNFQLEDLLHMNYFHLNLENVEKLRIEVHGEEEADEEDAILVALSQTIQIRMPKLQFFYLEFFNRGGKFNELHFMLRSKSLKNASIYGPFPHDLDCPLLEEFNGNKIMR